MAAELENRTEVTRAYVCRPSEVVLDNGVEHYSAISVGVADWAEADPIVTIVTDDGKGDVLAAWMTIDLALEFQESLQRAIASAQALDLAKSRGGTLQ